MSIHMIYYKDGAKMMRPVLTREEYLGLRNGGEQKHLVAAIRSGNEGLNRRCCRRTLGVCRMKMAH